MESASTILTRTNTMECSQWVRRLRTRRFRILNLQPKPRVFRHHYQFIHRAKTRKTTHDVEHNSQGPNKRKQHDTEHAHEIALHDGVDAEDERSWRGGIRARISRCTRKGDMKSGSPEMAILVRTSEMAQVALSIASQLQSPRTAHERWR